MMFSILSMSRFIHRSIKNSNLSKDTELTLCLLVC